MKMFLQYAAFFGLLSIVCPSQSATIDDGSPSETVENLQRHWYAINGVPRDSAGAPGLLNVRSGAGMDFPIITKVADGHEKIRVMGFQNNATTKWARISYDDGQNVIGWIAAKYLRPQYNDGAAAGVAVANEASQAPKPNSDTPVESQNWKSILQARLKQLRQEHQRQTNEMLNHGGGLETTLDYGVELGGLTQKAEIYSNAIAAIEIGETTRIEPTAADDPEKLLLRKSDLETALKQLRKQRTQTVINMTYHSKSFEQTIALGHRIDDMDIKGKLLNTAITEIEIKLDLIKAKR